MTQQYALASYNHIMSTISAEEVARLADLACIALSEEEVERLAAELAIIADSASAVAEVATPDVPATRYPMPLANVVREDIVGEVLDREEMLAQAPESEDGMFKVPQILEED